MKYPELSPVEAASCVMQKYGYLVIAYMEEVDIGGVIQSYDISGLEDVGQPFSVIGVTAQAEYDEHNAFLKGIGAAHDDDEEAWPYYYRITTD
jgi:hypothetical protein